MGSLKGVFLLALVAAVAGKHLTKELILKEELKKAHAAEDALLKFDKLLKKTLKSEQVEVAALKQANSVHKTELAAEHAKLLAEEAKFKHEEELLTHEKAGLNKKIHDAEEVSEKKFKAEEAKLKHEEELLKREEQKGHALSNKILSLTKELVTNAVHLPTHMVTEHVATSAHDAHTLKKAKSTFKEGYKKAMAQVKKQLASSDVTPAVKKSLEKLKHQLEEQRKTFKANYKKRKRSLDAFNSDFDKEFAQDTKIYSHEEEQKPSETAFDKNFFKEYHKLHEEEKKTSETAFDQNFFKQYRKDVAVAEKAQAEAQKEGHEFKHDFDNSFKAAKEFEKVFKTDLKSIARELDTEENPHSALAKQGFHANAAAVAAYNKRAGSVGAGGMDTFHVHTHPANHPHESGANLNGMVAASLILPVLAAFQL